MLDEKTHWPKHLLSLKDKLSQLEKMTNSDTINTSSNPHIEAQNFAMEVLQYWTQEIAIKPTKTALFKQLTSLMLLIVYYSDQAPKEKPV